MSWVIALAPVDLRVVHEIVAGAERPARSGQHDDVHGLVGIGALHGRRQLARQLVVDRVQDFGTVERDAGDAPVALVEHLGHNTSLLDPSIGADLEELRIKRKLFAPSKSGLGACPGPTGKKPTASVVRAQGARALFQAHLHRLGRFFRHRLAELAHLLET